MESNRYTISIVEAMAMTGMNRRVITYAVTSGKISSRKLPGRTGSFLLDPVEVRHYAQMQATAS